MGQISLKKSIIILGSLYASNCGVNINPNASSQLKAIDSPKISQLEIANGIMVINMSDSAHSSSLAIFSCILSNIYALSFHLMSDFPHSVYSSSWPECCLASSQTDGNVIFSSFCLLMSFGVPQILRLPMVTLIN